MNKIIKVAVLTSFMMSGCLNNGDYQNEILCLWAEVDPEEKVEEERVFGIIGTGHIIDNSEVDKRIHLKTVQQGMLVWHVYEFINNELKEK